MTAAAHAHVLPGQQTDEDTSPNHGAWATPKCAPRLLGPAALGITSCSSDTIHVDPNKTLTSGRQTVRRSNRSRYEILWCAANPTNQSQTPIRLSVISIAEPTDRGRRNAHLARQRSPTQTPPLALGLNRHEQTPEIEPSTTHHRKDSQTYDLDEAPSARL